MRGRRVRGRVIYARPYGFIDGEDTRALCIIDVLAVMRVAAIRCRTGPILELALGGPFWVHTHGDIWEVIEYSIPAAIDEFLKLFLGAVKG